MNYSRILLSMKDIQSVSLNILKFIATLCEREGFRYTLMYGTLIGAVRHKGYIPWDDDVDIMMPRPDYERFLKYVKTHKDEMGPYQLFTPESPGYLYNISRVSDSRYTIVKKTEKDCGMGIFIDVYPWDGLGDDYDTALDLLTKSRQICNTLCDVINDNVPKQLNWKGKLVYIIKRGLHRLKGLNHYRSLLNYASRTYNYDSSKYIGPAAWFFMKPQTVLFERADFEKFVKIPFEDGEFYVPEKYDKILTQEYGDYMTPPPEDQRVYHHEYKAYKR